MIYQTENLNNLYEALVKAQGEMDGAVKDSTNPHRKSSYASLESHINASRPFLVKNGLCVLQRVISQEGKYYLVTRLAHQSGQHIENSFELKTATNDMQGLGAAITYARRYAYSSLICQITMDDDDGEEDRKKKEEEEKKLKEEEDKKLKEEEEKQKMQPLTPQQIAEIEKLVQQDERLENRLSEILGACNLSEVSSLPRKYFHKCIKALNEELNK